MGHLTDALDGLQGSSIDKANELLQRLATAEADDEEGAQRLAMMKMLAPTVVSFMPTDPAELDQLLLAGAVLFLQGRSDDAPLYQIISADVDVIDAIVAAEEAAADAT